MTNASLATLGTYNPNFTILKRMGFSPCERDVFSKIVGLALNAKEVYISLKAFSDDLGYRRETICRSAKRLAQKGLIKFSNQKKHGIFSIVEVIPIKQNCEKANEADFCSPLIERSVIIDQAVNENCAPDQTIVN